MSHPEHPTEQPEKTSEASKQTTETTTSRHSTGEATGNEQEGNISRSYAQWTFLRAGAILQGVGILLALLPPHWATAGVISAALGTFLCVQLGPTKHVFDYEHGSYQRERARTNGSIAVVYGITAIATSLTAMIVLSSSIALGITFIVMAMLPLVLGIRQLYAARDIKVSSAIDVKWGHGTASVVAVFLLAFYFFTSTTFNLDSWLVLVGMLGGFFAVPLVVGNAMKLNGPKWTTPIVMYGPLALFFTGIVCRQAAWLTLFGKSPQLCTQVGAKIVSSRTNTSSISRFRCGNEVLDYNPLFSETVDTKNDQLVLVTDRLHVANPLQPHEIPGIVGTIYLTLLGITTISLVVAIFYPLFKSKN